MAGSWWQLLGIVREAKQQARFWRSQRPISCPQDGTTLITDPRGELACRFCGYRWDGHDHP